MKDLRTEAKWPKGATLAAQALGWGDRVTGAVIPPIHVSTTFARDDDYQLPDGRAYSRDAAASLDQAEAMIATFEEAADAMIFSSGLAACTAPFHALAVGARIVVPNGIYFGVTAWLQEFAEARGLICDFAPAGDDEALIDLIEREPTALVWIETPSNPLIEISDIQRIAEATHKSGGVLCVDSTAASPVLSKPLTLGADIVAHSATKYLNGHSDALAGALAVNKETDFWQRIRRHRYLTGPLPGGFDLHLLVRGMRTLFLRVEKQSANAMAVAQFLENHPRVEKTRYPGLASHPAHALAARQMQNGFGGLLSFHPKGGREAALQVIKALKIFIPATSLGGVESLIEHRFSIEPPGSGVPEDLLRVSVGIEAVEDLIADLDQALDKLPS